MFTKYYQVTISVMSWVCAAKYVFNSIVNKAPNTPNKMNI